MGTNDDSPNHLHIHHQSDDTQGEQGLIQHGAEKDDKNPHVPAQPKVWITQNKNAALSDVSNRQEAARQLSLPNPNDWAKTGFDDRKQAIDDLILEWVDKLATEIAEGRYS